MSKLSVYTFVLFILFGCSADKECGSVNISNLDSRETGRQFQNFYIEKKYREAKCVLDTMQERRPSIDYAWEYAQVYAGLGRKKRALEEFNRGLEKDPLFYTGYLHVGLGFKENEEYETARYVLEEAIRKMENIGAPDVCSYSPIQEEIFLLAAELAESKSEKARLLKLGMKHVSLSDDILNKLKNTIKAEGGIKAPCL